ncbi:MAG: protein jag [Acidobacteriota bacterium]
MAEDSGRRGEAAREDAGPAAAEEKVRADPLEIERLANRMLGGLGLEVSARAADAGESIEVDISGVDRDYFLDRRGEALNAVQYLLNRIVYRGRRGKKIHVDSDGFRRMREEEIVEIARRAAEKVLSRGEECALSPLNPYERRLVHLALREVEGIDTRSIGDGFLKRVLIMPTGERDAGTGDDRS